AGIRDGHVTGVQTCALPISRHPQPQETSSVARDKVVLAYSGGLDTSVAVKWIDETYGLDVIAYTCDLGQGQDIQAIREKALRTRSEERRGGREGSAESGGVA